MSAVCHEAVVRDGQLGPCDAPATGHAIDEESLYPACAMHETDTAEVMAAAVDVMRATRGMSPHSGATIRPLVDAEVRWAELMRDWMTRRGIEL